MGGVLLVCWLATLPARGPQNQAADDTAEPSQVKPIDLLDSNALIAVELGLRADEAPERWEGNISTSAGRILSTRGWHFAPADRNDRIVSTASWSFSTRRIKNPMFHGKERPPALLPNGVSVALDAPNSAQR